MNQFDYIKETYGLSLKRGQTVLALGKEGRVVGADHRVRVRLNGSKHITIYHPNEIKLLGVKE